MDWSRIRAYLRPDNIEDDPAFRQEIVRLSHRGMFVTGAVEIAAPILMFVTQRLAGRDTKLFGILLLQAAILLLIGIATLAVAGSKRAYPHSRVIVALSGWLAMTVLILTAVLLTPGFPGDDQFIPGQMTAVMLVAVATTPLRPLHTLTL